MFASMFVAGVVVGGVIGSLATAGCYAMARRIEDRKRLNARVALLVADR